MYKNIQINISEVFYSFLSISYIYLKKFMYNLVLHV